ncbi:hypothetical protein N9W34_02295 [Rickettsiales bacterium]|nr:hypothetical protein [Rickettsiales bacterium]
MIGNDQVIINELNKSVSAEELKNDINFLSANKLLNKTSNAKNKILDDIRSHISINQISYKWATEPFLIQQYTALVSSCYQIDYGLDAFSYIGSKKSKILLSLRGQQVVGGGQLISPSDEDSKYIQEALKRNNIMSLPDPARIIEFRGLIVRPELRESQCPINILKGLYKSFLQTNSNLLLIYGTGKQIKHYESFFDRAGIKINKCKSSLIQNDHLYKSISTELLVVSPNQEI